MRLESIGRLIRWSDWYDSKIPFFMLAYYYLLRLGGNPRISDLVLMVPLWVSLSALAAFGYMANDYFDVKIDALAGKRRPISRVPPATRVALLGLTITGGILSFVPFASNINALVLLLASYVLALTYSAPPIRLKERGALGMLSVSLAQRVLPLIVVFAIFDHFGVDTLILSALSLMIGLRWILIHQVHDRPLDEKAGVSTYVTGKASEKMIDILFWLVWSEVVLLSVALIVMCRSYSGLLVMALLYLLFQIYLFPYWRRLGRNNLLLSYRYAPLSDLYFLWLPFTMASSLVLLNRWFLILLVVELFWKKRYLRLDLFLATRPWGRDP